MRRNLCVVLLLGTAFFFVFSAFNSQGFIEIAVLRALANSTESAGITANSGYNSLSIIYGVFTVSNLVAPAILGFIGPKWSMVLGGAMYGLFMLCMTRITAVLLYFSSAALGFGAAVLWTGNGVYLTNISGPRNMQRNSGLMWAMLQASLIAGAVFLYVALGAADLASSAFSIYCTFFGVVCLGILLLVFLPSNPHIALDTPEGATPPSELEAVGSGEQPAAAAEVLIRGSEPTFWQTLVEPFKLLLTQRMLLLALVFIYTGMELTFYSGVYSSALAATKALTDGSNTVLAYASLALGIGEILGGLVFGMFASSIFGHLPRNAVILLACLLHAIAFFAAFLFIPANASFSSTTDIGYIRPTYTMAMAVAFLLGLADSCWITQIYSLIPAAYRDSPASAFALFKFFQSLAASVSFYYSSLLIVQWQLVLLICGLFVATLSFFRIQFTIDMEEREARLEAVVGTENVSYSDRPQQIRASS